MRQKKTTRSSFPSRLVAQVVSVILLLTAGVVLARAQGNLQNATVFGAVTDTSGATVPDATVTVKSPSLQGAQSAKSGEDGSYRISELPPGIYSVTFSREGFQPEVQENLRLTSGFTARVDVALKVGTATQTVEVTGAAPAIDTTSTTTVGEVDRVVMDQVPSTRAMTDAVYLTAGVRPSATPDIGGSNLGAQQGVGAYGFAANVVTLVEGVDVMQQSGGEHGGPTGGGLGQLPDYDGIADLTVITTGAQADIGEAGPVVIVTMKSGGNQYHGGAHILYSPKSFQLTNLPPNLVTAALGATGNQLQYFTDAQADLGGKIIRDRFWFYAGWHLEHDNVATLGLPAPDYSANSQGYNPTQQDDNEAKVTYQLTKNIRIVGDYNFMSKFNPEYTSYQTAASGFEPSYYYVVGFQNEKGEVIWTPSTKWVVDILGGYKYNYYSYPNQGGVGIAGNPYTMNNTTGNTSGADFNITQFDGGHHSRIVYTGTVSYVPNGKHQYQFGSQLFLPDFHLGVFVNHPAGNYELITCNAATGSASCPASAQYPAGAAEPLQLNTFNFPFAAEGREQAIGAYFKDTWRATKRMTINYGARFDYYNVYNTPVTAPAGPFSLGKSYPGVTVNTWKRFVPRVGVAYDLTGNGKNVIKAAYGILNIPFVGEFDLVDFNPASVTQTTYNWAVDTPVPGVKAGTPGYATLAPSAAFLNAITASLANPSATVFTPATQGAAPCITNGVPGCNIYTTTSSAALAQINPGLKLPYLHQVSVEFEHELIPNTVVRGYYVYQLEEDMYAQTYPNRPITDYTIAYNTTYPATDPVNGGKPLTIYTYPAAHAGGSYNVYQFTTRNGNPDFYNAIGFSLAKRQVNRWGAGVAVDFIKDHRYLNGSPFSTSNGFGTSADQPVAPYQQAFPLDLTWDYTLKSYLTSNLPYGVTLGLNYELLAGTPNYTTDQVTMTTAAASAVGGTSLGTITFPVNQYGSDRQPDQNVLNVRFGRIFHFKDNMSLEGTVELFNALNAAPAESVNYINGAAGGTKAFGYVNSVMPPFIGRFGATFKF